MAEVTIQGFTPIEPGGFTTVEAGPHDGRYNLRYNLRGLMLSNACFTITGQPGLYLVTGMQSGDGSTFRFTIGRMVRSFG